MMSVRAGFERRPNSSRCPADRHRRQRDPRAAPPRVRRREGGRKSHHSRPRRADDSRASSHRRSLPNHLSQDPEAGGPDEGRVRAVEIDSLLGMAVGAIPASSAGTGLHGKKHSSGNMGIRPPTWQLQSQHCSYCGGDGELVFLRCPDCRTIVLICVECGTAYSIQDKRMGPEVGDTSGATRCRSCGGAFHHDFPPATAKEIQSLGFVAGEYR